MDEGMDRIELEILYVPDFVCPMFVKVVHKGMLVRCLKSYASTNSRAFPRFVLVIHSFEESGYPFHFTKYWNPRPRFLLSRISSTLYSSLPSIRSGGGCSKLGPCADVSLYGIIKEVWNTGCIFHVGRSFSLNVTGPIFSSMTKGPCNFRASLSFGCFIVIFFPESQTFCPSSNSTLFSMLFLFISSAATSRLAFVSFLSSTKPSNCHSMSGISNLTTICGTKEGLYLYMSWNGDWCVAECSWMLCVNLAYDRSSGRFVYL